VRYPIALVGVALAGVGCGDTGLPPSGDGTLVVSTSTTGNEPDLDGYLLAVDAVRTLALVASGSAQMELPAGRHTVRLSGVAEHCAVDPATSLDVDIDPQGTTALAFEIDCSVSGARIVTTTTGLDFDADGYRLAVDGADQGVLPVNDTVLIPLDPGSRTLALAELAPNCTISGAGSYPVTIVDDAVVTLDFAVVCTATSGVIRVVIGASGAGALWEVTVDGGTPYAIGRGGPGPFERYIGGVRAGRRLVSLSAANCTVGDNPRSVTVTAGTLIRDTVTVTFSPTCETAIRVTAPTTGKVPRTPYSVWVCHDIQDACYWGPTDRLGALAPNDTLVAAVRPGRYELYLRDLPANCHVNGSNPKRDISINAGALRDFAFFVVCS
jgi:hypothetical protein